MDTHDYDYWVQFTRLRSKRDRKKAQKEDEDKQLIRRHKEELALRNQLRSIEWTELKPPVQRGFIRFYVLRDDVARTKQAAFFRAILEKINTTQWSYRKDFLKKRRRLGKKVYVVREQRLKDIESRDFLGKKFNEQERLCFEETLVHSKKSKVPDKVYRFSESWRFVLKVQPNMITRIQVKNLDLERQMAEMDCFFDHERRLRLWRLQFGSNRWSWDSRPNGKYKDSFRNKSFASVLDEHWPEPNFTVITNPRQDRGFFFFLRVLSLVFAVRLTRSV
jgi:hypothetical protein